MSNFLKGKKFHLSGFQRKREYGCKQWITKAGGDIVKSDHPGIDYLLIPSIDFQEETIKKETIEIKAHHTVTNFWIEDCIVQSRLLPVLYFHQPFNTAKLRDFEGIVICIANYVTFERLFLTNLAEALGMVVQESFAYKDKLDIKKSTHLVSSVPEGSIYEASIDWNRPVVSKDWILACLQDQKWVSERPFLIGACQAFTPGKPMPFASKAIEPRQPENAAERRTVEMEAAHQESRKIDKKFTKFEKDDGNKENIESEKGSEFQKTGETSGKENKNKKKECTEPSKEETDEAVDQNSASQGDENSRKNKQKEEGEKDTTAKKRKRSESSQEGIDEDAVDQDRKKKKSKKKERKEPSKEEIDEDAVDQDRKKKKSKKKERKEPSKEEMDEDAVDQDRKKKKTMEEKERKELSQEEIDEDAVDQDGKKKKTKKKERKEPSTEEMDEDAVDQDGKKKKPKKSPEFVQYDTGYNYYCPVKTCDWSETRNVFQFKRLDSVKRHCKTKHSKFYGEGAPKSRMLKVLWRDAPKRRNLCLQCNQIVASLSRHRQKCPGEPKGVALIEMPQTYTLADKELLYNLYAVDYVAQISTKQVQDDCQKNNHLNQLFNQMKTAKGTVRRVIASFKYIVNAYGQTKKEEAEGEELHGQMPQDDINNGKTSYSEADKELLYQLFAVDYAPSVTSKKMDEYCKTNEQFKELFDRVKEDKRSKKKIRISFKNCLYDYCKLKKREDAGGDMAKTRQRLRRRTMTKWTTSS